MVHLAFGTISMASGLCWCVVSSKVISILKLATVDLQLFD